MPRFLWPPIIYSAFSVLLDKAAPGNFIGRPLGSLIGPFVMCFALHKLSALLQGNLTEGPSNLGSAFILLVLMTISFLYVRRRILGKAKPDAKELQTNERRPLLPPHSEVERETEDHAGN